MVILVSDNNIPLQAFIDSLPLSSRSVLFGPHCELALAPVGRQLKVRFHLTNIRPTSHHSSFRSIVFLWSQEVATHLTTAIIKQGWMTSSTWSRGLAGISSKKYKIFIILECWEAGIDIRYTYVLPCHSFPKVF